MIKNIFRLVVSLMCFIGIVFIALTFLDLVKVIDWTIWKAVGFLGAITLLITMFYGSAKAIIRGDAI